MRSTLIDSIKTVKENEKHVKDVVKAFTEENYTELRLKNLLARANEYEIEQGGSKANRIVIKAAETRLKELNHGTL